jgi:hypothetical protein
MRKPRRFGREKSCISHISLREIWGTHRCCWAKLAVVITAGLLCCKAQAANCNLASGASQSAIVAALAAASAGTCSGGPNVVTFAPGGTFGPITSTVTIPCGANMFGSTVPYSQTPNQTATITGSPSFTGWGFQTTAGCSAPQTIQYLAWNGEQPTVSGGGGGFLEIVAGTANLTVQNNWLHGVTAPSTDGGATGQNIQANLINFGGGISGAVTNNVTIQNNIFGSTSLSDCAGAMTEVDTENGGGYCNGIGIGANVVNVTVQNNIFHYLEEGVKFYEGQGECNPLTVNGNDFSHIQRIMYETQCNNITAAMNMNIEYNSFHDRGNSGISGQQNYDLSVANGCTSPTPNNPTNCVTNIDYNFDLGPNGQADVGVEVWGGTGTNANYNLLQGYLYNGITWSASGLFTFNNNTFNLVANGPDNTNCTLGTGGFWNREKNGETATPSCTGNTFSNAITGTIASAAPTLSPASGSFSGSVVVTLTNPGLNRDANTTDWCTTDGSTPVPGSGTAVPHYNGGSLTITSTTKLQCVGMWGAPNQPYSYTSGYGYVPSSLVSATYTAASGYYLSPSGSDSAAGTSSAPWLTPNHALSCGQTITALPGTYAAANFQSGHWGTVSCPAGNNVVWLQCQTFDACKITSASGDAMWVDQSYWGVQGWENSTSVTANGACFHAGPSGSSTIHHIIFANDVANGCMGGGFTAYRASTTASVDYLAFVGDVAYNAAQGSGACYSGLNIYEPIASDTNTGTHMFVAGNFAYANVDGDPCAGTAPTDGEGVNLDTFDFDQGGGTPYTQQAVVENNISVLNGGRGVYAENNAAGTTHAPIYFRYNTLFGNNSQASQASCSGNGDLSTYNALNLTATYNLVQTDSATMCSSPQAKYAMAVSAVNPSVVFDYNFADGVGGNNTYIYTGDGFTFGPHNVIGTNPAYVNAANPGPPSCSGTANAPACMATLRSNFTPTITAALPYGYQAPQSGSVNDPLYPAWLCNVTLPPGLVTPGCSAASPQAATPVLSPASESFSGTISVSVTDSTVGSTIYCTSNGTPPTTSSPAYGAPFSVSATSNIQCLAAASGYTASAVGGGTYTLAGPNLTGGYQGNTGSMNTLTVGQAAIQQTAVGTYSDGSTHDLPDAWGNTAVWSSSNASILRVTSSGLISCAAAGTANSLVSSSPGGVSLNEWTWTCYAAPTLQSVTLATTGDVTSINYHATVQILATCHYSDGSTTSCNTADSHGNAVGTWVTSSPAYVTISGAGVATGAAIGSSNLTAVAAGITSSPALALPVTSTATLVSAYLGPTSGSCNPTNSVQFAAYCHYTAGADQSCTVTDMYGDAVTGWTSGTIADVTIGNVGSAHPGLAACVAAGSSSITATVNGTLGSSASTVTVTNSAITLTGISISTTGGVTGLAVGATNQLQATCTYSDGSTTSCTTTDAHGNVASAWASSNPLFATVSSSGLATGVGTGLATFTANAGGHSSTAIPLAVSVLPPGTYNITITGPVTLTGTVHF